MAFRIVFSWAAYLKMLPLFFSSAFLAPERIGSWGNSPAQKWCIRFRVLHFRLNLRVVRDLERQLLIRPPTSITWQGVWCWFQCRWSWAEISSCSFPALALPFKFMVRCRRSWFFPPVSTVGLKKRSFRLPVLTLISSLSPYSRNFFPSSKSLFPLLKFQILKVFALIKLSSFQPLCLLQHS